MSSSQLLQVEGGGATRLSVQRCGRPDGPPVVLLHGFCQSHLAWSEQLCDPALQAFDLWAPDLRGHGLSDKPVAPGAYQDARLWADDLAAVIRAAGNRPVTLVAWSYAGYIVADYLAAHGPGRVAAVNLVGAAVKKVPDLGHLVGAGFKSTVADLTSADLLTTLKGVRKLALECTRQPLGREALELAQMVACMTPHYVRQAMLARTVAQDAAWHSLQAPVLVTHGRHDAVILPGMVDVTQALLPHSRVSWYEDCGHSPFSESPERFNRELARLVVAATSAEPTPA